MFVCNECGAQAPRWQGRCTVCGAWSTLEAAQRRGGHRARPPPRAKALAEFAATPPRRRSSCFAELDRAVGGGLVPGSTVLVGGEPGIGKSTLLLAVCARVQGKAIYVAGEESPALIALRAKRLALDPHALLMVDDTDTEHIADILRAERPELCVVDSVQTMRTPGVDGIPGGPAQVRAAADALVPVARETGSVLLLVGQVTKVGGLAGPRLLEHAVDTVLMFEGDRHTSLRALRPIKNRFGPTDEIGLFEMRDDGLHEVRNASDLLLAERFEGPGAAVACVVEGRRPMCVEVQALLIGKGPRRRAQGVDPRRIEVLAGVLESKYEEVGKRDVLVNVVGGLTISDTALDLAVVTAVLSELTKQELARGAVLIGEVGLRGEVRSVARLGMRLKEAKAMGFERAFVPRGTSPIDGLQITEVAHVVDLLDTAVPQADQ